jgi:hypothetical protein
MMTASDLRGATLRAFDNHAHDFTRECATRYETGAALAAGEIDRLAALADRVASDIAAWSKTINELEMSRHGAFQPVCVGQSILECAFDDLLAPAATRVLAAALDLALSRP